MTQSNKLVLSVETGGLLAVSCYGSATTNCFPAFDGNGNVAALVNAADGTVAANDEYAAFGEPVRVTGVMARNNPFRFLTKYADDESDLLYYGYRYYKPSTGSWKSRDPLGEKGGVNLYIMVWNNPINRSDKLGLCTLGNVCCPICEIAVTIGGADPSDEEAQDALVSAAGSIENLDAILNAVDTGGAALSGDVEGALASAAESVGGLAAPDAQSLAQQAKDVYDKAEGNMNGYTLFTQIKYKECQCRFFIFGSHMVSDKTTHDDWEEYKKGGDLGLGGEYAGVSQDKYDAYKLAPEACKEHIAEWMEKNKKNIESQ